MLAPKGANTALSHGSFLLSRKHDILEKVDQYLVVPKSQDKSKQSTLLQFLNAAEKIPSISIVRVVGDSDNPKRVIIQGTADAINELKTSFDRDVIIETDSSLNLF